MYHRATSPWLGTYSPKFRDIMVVLGEDAFQIRYMEMEGLPWIVVILLLCMY